MGAAAPTALTLKGPLSYLVLMHLIKRGVLLRTGYVKDAMAQWDYERLKSNFHEFKSRRERKNLFKRYSYINFCLDTKIYFASSALASTIIRLFGRGTTFQFRAFSALVVLNYSYCCPDCGVRIEHCY